MSLSKNKRGVEALPLRYIIIALVAVLVIAIVLEFTGVLRTGTIGAAERINETLTEKTICALDDGEPTITDFLCSEDDDKIQFKLMDECGVDDQTVTAFVFEGNTSVATITLNLIDGDITSGTWEGSGDLDDQEYNITVWADDEADVANHLSTTYENYMCDDTI